MWSLLSVCGVVFKIKSAEVVQSPLNMYFYGVCLFFDPLTEPHAMTQIIIGVRVRK